MKRNAIRAWKKILLNKTNCTILMEWLTALGKYKTEHKEEGKARRTAIITSIREKWYSKRETQYIVIESIPWSTEIRFPKKQSRKSKMPMKKMDCQDQSSISNSNLTCNVPKNAFKWLKSYKKKTWNWKN